MVALTATHDAVLALLDWLPEDHDADAALVAELLRIPEAEAARLLDDLEGGGLLGGAPSGLGSSCAATSWRGISGAPLPSAQARTEEPVARRRWCRSRCLRSPGLWEASRSAGGRRVRPPLFVVLAFR
jgi:hypothetical protein